jgi:uncharacterized protein involved in exopolysaccharide biosynthesis
VNAEAADTATMADTPATPPLPARKPGSDVTPASPDKRRTIGATREERADPAYEGTEADKLIADIKNTRRQIELLDQRIEVIANDIENERSTLRDTVTEFTQEAAGTKNRGIETSEKERSENGQSRRGRGRKIIDGLSTGIGVADAPEDIGTTRKVPKHIQEKQTEIERLQKQKEKLEQKLEQLRAKKSRDYPRHVPAWD